MKRKNVISLVLAVLLLISLLTACNGAVDITLSFIVDGEVYHTIDTKGDGLITLPTNPTKEDYVFDGWFWEDGRPFTVNSLKDTPISEDLSVYAKWHSVEDEENDITITFTVIGGGAVPSQTIGYDGLINRPENPVRAGHILVGWFTDADCTTRWDFANGKVRTDIILYAKWVSETDMNNVEIVKAEGITVGNDTLKTTVPAAQDKYKVFDNLEANPYATIKVYRDEQGSQEIKLGLIDLVAGDNINYIMITSGTGTVNKLYTLTIHRNFMFDVTFNYNNGNSADTTKVEEGKLVSSRSAGRKTGYTFDKWQYNGSAWAFDTAKVTGNMTLDAKWNANKYPVSFDTNGGNSLNNTTVTYGQDFELSVPVREHYTFLGWETADGTTLTDEQGNSISSWDIPNETNLKAKWELKTYTISYTDTYDAENTNPTSFTFETETITLNSLSGRNGYTFIEWQDIEGEKVTSIPKGSSGEITLKAVWEIIDYTITYNNTFDLDNTNASGYNVETSTITLSNLSGRTGYTFNGWYTAPTDGTKKTDIEKGSYGNLQLYARWTTNRYTVSLDRESSVNSFTINFDGNGYDLNIPTQTLTDESSLYYPDVPNRSGYIFSGWYENSEGTGNSFDFTAEIKTDIVLYAKWVSSSSPIYVGESKSIYISGQTYNNYEFIPLVSGNITIYTTGSVDTYGYLLQGNNQLTYNDDGGSNTNFSITYNVTAGVKYTIKVRGYGSGSSGNSVLYLIGVSKPTAGGTVTSGSNAVTVSYGTNYSLGVPESIKGYAFDGWYTEIDCGGTKLTNAKGASLNIWSIDGDIVVYSGYQRLPYNVEFVANGGSTVSATSLYYGDRLDLNEYITTRSGYSFIGWYLDINDSEAYEATTMPDHNLSLKAKWIVYNLNDFKYNIEKLAISEFDTINAALFNAELFDSDGELVEIEATLNGTQEAGQTVSIRLLASGKYDKIKQVTINNIKVYGMPSISYDTEKDYFNLSDTLNSALFGLSGKDTYDVDTITAVSVQQESYAAGDLVTIILTSTDPAGNVTTREIANVKVYGEPDISYTETKTDIKASDTVGNELWNVSALDNFGETLSATTEIISGSQAAGNTITVRISSTDSKGNTRNITFDVRVYGTPTIGTATKTDFKVSDDITVESLGIGATDSHNGTVEDVSIIVKSGTQTSGTYMIYTVTAVDLVGNIATKDITVKIFDLPVFAPQTKTGIKTNDDLSLLSSFAVTAKDSFNAPLTAAHTLKSGSQTVGTVMVYTFTATDAANNIASVEYSYQVYAQSDITITYQAGASDLVKLTSQGEEFFVTATDSFGEPCTIKLLKADGTVATSGTTINIIFRATDAAGNYKDTPVISNIKIYGTPIAAYTYDYYYLKQDDNIDFMFTVRDSFNSELYADVTQISYESGIRTVSVTATDDAGNLFERTYELYQLAANQSYLALYSGTEFLGYHIVTQGEDYNLPIDFIIGYNRIWQLDNQDITNSDGNSLSVWNKPSNGYRVQLISSLITYNISYILDGGVNNIDNPSTYTVESLGGADGAITLSSPAKVTDTITLPSEYIGNGEYRNTLEVTAYTFLGWYKDSSFAEEVSVITLALGTATLYAKWSSTTTTTTTTTTAYQRIKASGVPTANGNYILFGEYPQTIKANEVTVGTSADTRGYYLGSDGYYYAKVTATPYSSGYTFSTSATVSSGTVYYFKVKPIKWRILTESGGTAFILCESIIANKRYDNSSNNYMNSEIRAWLNGEFYNKAFNELQQELIQITNVDNSAYSTGISGNANACANTNDKIFLPSYREMVNTAYGFNSEDSAYDTARRRITSDYSRATGACMYTDSSYYGNGGWWLRSPSSGDSISAGSVHYGGGINFYYIVYDTYHGVVPALKIRL